MKSFNNNLFEKYKSEAKDRWGCTDTYKEHEKRTKDYTNQKWDDLAFEMDVIMSEFAECMNSGKAPDSAEAQNLVRKLQSHITDNYYNCTNVILAGLGQMYVCDERFKKNIDKHGEGTADFISWAIKVYCADRT